VDASGRQATALGQLNCGWLAVTEPFPLSLSMGQRSAFMRVDNTAPQSQGRNLKIICITYGVERRHSFLFKRNDKTI